MKIATILSCVLVLLSCQVMGTETNSKAQKSELTLAWQDLQSQLQSHKVVSLRVLMIPYNAEPFFHTDAKSLELNAELKCRVQLSQSDRLALVAAIRETTATTQRREPDMHWGIKFIDNRGEEISALYLGLEWNDGSVDSELNGKRASINNRIIRWLDERFSIKDLKSTNVTSGKCE